MENAGTGMVRVVDELGRVVLPIELRRKLGIEQSDPLEFFYDTSSNRIMLRKYRAQECYFCFSTKQLTFFRERFVCDCCLNEISQKIGAAAGHATTK